jgi:sugar phosphate permease
MTVLGMTIFGAGFIMLGFVNDLWMYFAAFFVISVGSSLGGFVVLATAINHWFRRRRTLAQSLAQTGMGFGGIILIPILVWAQDTFGWREASIATGVASILIGVPMGLVMRKSPEPYGLRPDGEDADPAPRASDKPAKPDTLPRGNVDFTVGEAVRTPAFWLIGAGHGLSVMVVGAITTHQFAHMEMAEGVGLSRAGAALVVTVLSAVNIGGRFLAGIIGDRYDKRYIAAAGNVLGCIALLMLALAPSIGFALGYAVLFGISWGIRGPMMSSIRGDYFGRAHFGKIIGSSNLITTPLSLIAPIFAGFMADWQGDYKLGFVLLAFFSLLGAVAFLAARPPKPPARLAGKVPNAT